MDDNVQRMLELRAGRLKTEEKFKLIDAAANAEIFNTLLPFDGAPLTDGSPIKVVGDDLGTKMRAPDGTELSIWYSGGKYHVKTILEPMPDPERTDRLQTYVTFQVMIDDIAYFWSRR